MKAMPKNVLIRFNFLMSRCFSRLKVIVISCASKCVKSNESGARWVLEMRADGKLLFRRLIANSAFFMLAARAFVYCPAMEPQLKQTKKMAHLMATGETLFIH
jgi:hypothetical protein